MSDSVEKIIADMRCYTSAFVETRTVRDWANRLAALSGQAAQTAAPVAYGLQSTRDGSLLHDELAYPGNMNFDKRMFELVSHEWVQSGAAVVVPLCAAPPASKQIGEIDFKDGTKLNVL